MKLLIALAVSSVLSSPVFACQFDVDCSVGSKCLKSSGSLYGMCVGGQRPGNMYDNQPVTVMPDVTGKKGNTCQFDVNCGPGGQCIKGNGLYGTCM